VTEASEPLRASVDLAESQKDWANAAIGVKNLSELELMLGQSEALRNADQSVVFANRSGDADLEVIMGSTHADGLHQSGRRTQSEALFREAESLQARRPQTFPKLFSVAGFQYCDLLLTGPELAAWQTLLAKSRPKDVPADNGTMAATSVISCRVTFERAAQTRTIAKRENRLLDIALDDLTLGRAALYEFVLQSRVSRGESAQTSPSSPLGMRSEKTIGLTSVATSLDVALNELRRAASHQYLPLGLFSRAWCSVAKANLLRQLDQERQAVDCETSARRDLDEAWEIAERGPMPLFLADTLLHRARLFRAVTPYPWISPQADLVEARRLIEKHGYWRRKEELEDAEAAMLE